jgi:signal transduction histidine kinase
MNQRPASRLAWGLWGLAVALLAGALSLTFANGFFEEDPFVVVVAPLAVLGYATVGTLISARHHRNPIGWLFLSFALNFALAGVTDQYVIRGVRVAPGSLPLIDLAVWIQNVVFVPAFSVIPLVFLLFPTGRLLSARWRPVAWAMVVLPAIGLAGLTIQPGEAGGTVLLPNPTAVESLRPLATVLMTVGAIGSVSAAMACVVSLVVRFRRARGEERQQVRWLAYVAAAAAVLLVGTFGIGFAEGDSGPISNVLFVSFISMLALGVPVASGIAILKYRLYDLDIVVKKTVVFGILAGFITLAYVLVVVAIPAAVLGGGGSGTEYLFPFAAAGVLAIAFQPVRRWATRLANRLVYGKRATPYEVLSEFAARMGGTYSAEDVLPRMARILGEGSGAGRAEVWLRVGAQLRLEAAWPAQGRPDRRAVPLAGEELPDIPGIEWAVPVRHHDELLGALTVAPKRGETFTPANRKLVEDLASQGGLVLRNVRLIEELRASRQRLVAAQDEERRRLERNIHDGAQQQLVALAVKLRLAEGIARKDPAKGADLVAEARGETQEALENLRDLARGIYPPLLADRGLAVALEAQARKSPVPVEVEVDSVGRYPAEVEAGMYFCVLEALQNIAKYADASRAIVRLWTQSGRLSMSVRDDGSGFDVAATRPGTGLLGMADRIEALGGAFEIRSGPGEGTIVSATVPVAEAGR